MTKQEQRAWTIVGGLFVTLLIVFGGGYDTASVFFTPLTKHFGWSRAQTSSLTAALAAAAGLGTPLIGWLLDRVEARIVMPIGAAMCGLAFLGASQVNSYGPMLACYLLLGVGIAASTLLPASMVVANWFTARRGLAMGITFAGTSLGGALMALVANHAITIGGWRAGYIWLGVPMIVIAVPIIIVLIRTRPPSSGRQTIAQSAAALDGLEIAEALRSRSLWLMAAAQFCFAFAAAGGGLHLIPYLIVAGYTPATGAMVLSLVLVCTSLGKMLMGSISDRVSGRTSLTVNFMISAAGFLMLLGTRNPALLVAFVLVYGLSLGAPLVLVPLVMVDSLGLRRYGSLSGLTGVLNTIGATLGPILVGHIFDVTGSYSTAYELCAAMLVIGGIATYGCLPLEVEQARLAPMIARGTAS